MTFKPMLACSKIPNLEDIKYPVFASPKLDGIRCIIGEDGKAYSRNMKLIPNKHIQSVLQKLKLPQLDGELMIKGDFNSVQSAVMSQEGVPDFTYKVFDLVTPYLPFKERYSASVNCIDTTSCGAVCSVDHWIMYDAKQLFDYWELCLKRGYEGVIVRSLNGPYKQGRSTMREGYMLKLKKFFDDEAEIISYEELMRNTDTSTKQLANLYGANMLGTLVVKWQNKEFKIGSGFDEATRKQLWQNPEVLIGKQVTFKYQEVSKYGIPRFPVFKALRDGY